MSNKIVQFTDSNGNNVYPTGIYYVSGETWSTGRIYANGTVTSTKSEIYFSVALPKYVTQVSCTISALKVNARSSAGSYLFDSAYVIGGYDCLSNYTCAIDGKFENIVTIMIKSSSAFNVTNNTPVALEINRLTLTFS